MFDQMANSLRGRIGAYWLIPINAEALRPWKPLGTAAIWVKTGTSAQREISVKLDRPLWHRSQDLLRLCKNAASQPFPNTQNC